VPREVQNFMLRLGISQRCSAANRDKGFRLQLSTQEFALLFVASFLFTSFFTSLMRSVALKFGITDKPNQKHKTHKEPVPYLGGLAIVFGVISVTYATSLLTNFTQQTFFLASTILAPALIMAATGLVDDIKQLKPWPRFVTQNIIAIIATSILISNNTLGSPVGFLAIDFAITLFWLVGISNSINFFDNIDGGASGTAAIISLALFFIAMQNGQFLVAAMSIVLSGSTLGFLTWNKPPARIYMGDAGSLFLGILIASLTVRVDTNGELGSFSLLIPFFLLAVPILDTSTAVVKRFVRGVSPFQGGKDHLSHRLMRLGHEKRKAVLLLWALSAFYAVISILILNSSSIPQILFIALGVVSWIVLFFIFLATSDN
jgi:UDP-GlcNAc:undecaprenyl-phosphate GlcNAc-1-phosphate transferase